VNSNNGKKDREGKLLELNGISKFFGGLAALRGVSTQIRREEIVGLIGPNGAGKTTLFNVITAFYKPSEGNIFYNSRDITRLKPHEVAMCGITRTYQQNNLFHEFSVERNIFIASHIRPRCGILEDLLGRPSAKQKRESVAKKTEEILDLLEMKGFRNELARNLPHGFQRLLGIGIALASEPEMLLLDEPFSGMNVAETERLMDHIRRIHEDGKIGVLLVEHDMKAVMGLCERIIVLNFGEKIAEGAPQEIRENPAVIEAYLGVDDVVQH
jgi:branched-chain amino acid transport system ATP-binding protein